jgi:hypothetical protein
VVDYLTFSPPAHLPHTPMTNRTRITHQLGAAPLAAGQ